ncbi:hypothetical protein [Streptomyces sp. NBC_01429]|uniref:hypothetical protein n=1 Tax=Streptomyces sp. NBC_01429 TaxID=2903862 RepID=UPI002E2B4F85|nr:hypothetical protein [Streptomyces sp. NBC_01429]
MASPSCDAPRGRTPLRIAVLGSPGSGKTAFCHLLAVRTGLPLYHLDDLYWSPGWSRPGEAEWAHRIDALCALPRWIADGNYAGSAEPRARAAGLVVLIDRHPLLCAAALVRRSLRLRRTAHHPGTAPRGRHGPEYVPRRLREAGDPPVLSLTALLRKALLFRRRDLVVIHDALHRTGTPVRRCRTRRQAAVLLAELARSAPYPPSPELFPEPAVPGERHTVGPPEGRAAEGQPPEGRARQGRAPDAPEPYGHPADGRSAHPAVTPCTCPAAAAPTLWRSP